MRHYVLSNINGYKIGNLFFVCLIYFLIVTSCGKENRFDCFKSSGKDARITRNLESFDSLIVHDKFIVTIVKGSAYSVEIIAGQNLVSSISILA